MFPGAFINGFLLILVFKWVFNGLCMFVQFCLRFLVVCSMLPSRFLWFLFRVLFFRCFFSPRVFFLRILYNRAMTFLGELGSNTSDFMGYEDPLMVFKCFFSVFAEASPTVWHMFNKLGKKKNKNKGTKNAHR